MSETLLSGYDALLSDLDGVVYAGPFAIPGAPEALNRAEDSGTPVVFVTNNASRSVGSVAEHLRELGVKTRADRVVSSAQASAALLAQQLPARAKVLVTGTDALANCVREAGLTSSPSYTDADGEESVWNSSDWSVTSQDPAAGEQVPADQAITLTVNDDSAEAAASASASASAAAAEASASAAASEQAAQDEPVQDEPAQPEEPAQRPQQDPKKSTSTYYANCTEAKAAGAAPMYEGDPGYRSGLDRDHDGIACDK